jgi:transcriptional regulator GlxA family with amidase domain
LIAVFAQSKAHLLEYSGATDVFSEAALQSDGQANYAVRIIAEAVEPIVCLSGARLVPDRTIDDPDEPIDTLIITGNRNPLADPPSPAVLDWIRRRTPTARRWGSVCTGAFLLGAAGLLNGRHVTTHWEFADDLAAAYPSAIVAKDRIFVRDGPCSVRPA